ncbi:MAG: hypothetical protein ACTHMS_17955 [Jatrophihabitans sp.]|uniref:hypothetical protein n=1 Tax=Jatrophihabitans sp. TaxID=1932789 RepID=UPI003F80B080
MSRPVATALLAVVMVATIVAVDIVVFRHHFWPRLAANVGIVLIFGALYYRFVHH